MTNRIDSSDAIFDLNEFEIINSTENLFKVDLEVLPYGWLNVILSTTKKTKQYKPNLYCYPLELLLNSAIFAIQNKNLINNQFELQHDVEKEGYCYWNIKILTKEKLKLLVRLNPDLELEDDLIDLHLEINQNDLEAIKTKTLIAIEIDSIEYSKEILRSIKIIKDSQPLNKYYQTALHHFPIKEFEFLCRKISLS